MTETQAIKANEVGVQYAVSILTRLYTGGHISVRVYEVAVRKARERLANAA
jgi:hypothetical protein